MDPDYRTANPQPCWYCVHWAGPCWGDPYMADCRRDGRRDCKADAARGCTFWMRETGVDDDAWSPEPLIRPWTPERKPKPMTAATYAAVRQIQTALDARALPRTGDSC